MNYLTPLLRWGCQALLLILLILLVRRKQHRKFSWFAAYVAVEILTFIVRYAVIRNATAYYIA